MAAPLVFCVGGNIVMRNKNNKKAKYLALAQDSMVDDGPKNETLAEHREHCEARENGHPERCPFEKKAIEADKTDTLSPNAKAVQPSSNESKADDNSAHPTEKPWFEDCVNRYADYVKNDKGAMALAKKRYSTLSGDTRFMKMQPNDEEKQKICDWNIDLLKRGLQNTAGFERFRYEKDALDPEFDAEGEIIAHQRRVDIQNGAKVNPISASRAGLNDVELKQLASEVSQRCNGRRDPSFYNTAYGFSPFKCWDMMDEAVRRYVADLDSDGIEKIRHDLGILKAEGDGFLLPPERIAEITRKLYETQPYIEARASREESAYKQSLLYDQSASEVKGDYKCPPEEREKVNGERLKYIRKLINDSIKEDGSPVDPESLDGKNAGITYEKCKSLEETFNNAPYEIVLNVFNSHPSIQFMSAGSNHNGDAFCNKDGFVMISNSEWTFNPRTMSHECGHCVFDRNGQADTKQISDKFNPILAALHEDSADFMRFWGEGSLDVTMLNRNIAKSEQYANAWGKVKHLSLLKTMPEKDFDALAETQDVHKCDKEEIDEYSAITDTLCAASKGLMFCGHDESYYNNEVSCIHEPVAHITSSLCLGWKMYPKIFPRTYAAVKKLVYGMDD